MLDTKDKKILYQLDIDSRQAASSIAKKVGLKKDTVHYRINSLIHKGIINKFITVLNTPLLGFMHFNTLFRFRNITPTLRREFIEFSIAHPRIIWCASCFGSWDFSVSFLAKDLQEYDLFIQEILSKFGNDIHEKSMSLILDSPTYTREYLIDGKNGKEVGYSAFEKKKMDIDNIDHTILKIISQNADLSFVELTQKTKLSLDVVRYHLKQLYAKGIIVGYKASLNLEKIGYSRYKVLFSLADLTKAKESEFRQYCKQHPNIIQFIKYLGAWEIQIELEVATEAHLYQIVEELRNRFEIIKTYDVLRLKEEKLDYYPFHKRD